MVSREMLLCFSFLQSIHISQTYFANIFVSRLHCGFDSTVILWTFFSQACCGTRKVCLHSSCSAITSIICFFGGCPGYVSHNPSQT